jgi:hypothetical protein
MSDRGIASSKVVGLLISDPNQKLEYHDLLSEKDVDDLLRYMVW